MTRTPPTRSRRPAAAAKARQILALLEAHPAGLTIFEIAARVRTPLTTIVPTLAAMQRRKWLRTGRQSELRRPTTG